MLGDVSGLEKIYIVCGYTDAKEKSIDGLCTVIETQLKMDPSSVLSSFSVKKTGTGSKALFRERMASF